MYLNAKRQVIAANRAFCVMAGITIEDVIGKRPGEIMRCEHADEGPDGCGTAEGCRFCGAVRTVLDSRAHGRPHTRQCRLRLQSGAALNLRITASGVTVEDHEFTAVFIEDVSGEARRKILEHTFFHDVINLAGGIVGLSDLLAAQVDGHPDHAEEIAALAYSSAALLEEIEYHRDIMYAESGDLRVCRRPVRVSALLRKIVKTYSRHPTAQDRSIHLDRVDDATVETDSRLFTRIVGNMIKNALEATAPGGIVAVSCTRQDPHVVLSVHNDAVMPEEVKSQIFQRSFSTKGDAGRGIGTFSMKLFAERFLGGQVTFVSEPAEGTTFRLTLPERPGCADGTAPTPDAAPHWPMLDPPLT